MGVIIATVDNEGDMINEMFKGREFKDFTVARKMVKHLPMGRYGLGLADSDDFICYVEVLEGRKVKDWYPTLYGYDTYKRWGRYYFRVFGTDYNTMPIRKVVNHRGGPFPTWKRAINAARRLCNKLNITAIYEGSKGAGSVHFKDS